MGDKGLIIAYQHGRSNIMEGVMGGKDDLIIDFNAIRNISVKSLESGTPGDIIERTLVKIGLTKDDAKKMVKQAREEIKRKQNEAKA